MRISTLNNSRTTDLWTFQASWNMLPFFKPSPCHVWRCLTSTPSLNCHLSNTPGHSLSALLNHLLPVGNPAVGSAGENMTNKLVEGGALRSAPNTTHMNEFLDISDMLLTRWKPRTTRHGIPVTGSIPLNHHSLTDARLYSNQDGYGRFSYITGWFLECKINTLILTTLYTSIHHTLRLWQHSTAQLCLLPASLSDVERRAIFPRPLWCCNLIPSTFCMDTVWLATHNHVPVLDQLGCFWTRQACFQCEDPI